MLRTEKLIDTGTFRQANTTVPLLHRMLRTVYVWQQRVSERAQLASLEDRDLEDVGLSREQIAAEIAKPFWRP